LRRISILNFKGGTGKSSLVENLSYALARRGRHVLVVDCDRQSNASTTLLAGPPEPPTLTQVLKGEKQIAQAIRSARPGLDVIPSDGDLDIASTYIAGHRAAYYSLRKALDQLSYDFVLFDHAGAYTPVMEAALLASSEMLIPCELEPYATQGLFSMFEKLAQTLVDHELQNSGIIPYNVDLRYAMSRQYLAELRAEFGDLITAPVRTDATVPRAQSMQQTVFEYDEAIKQHSRVADDFKALALDLIEEREGPGNDAR
jgi:chromosome partitioning protein